MKSTKPKASRTTEGSSARGKNWSRSWRRFRRPSVWPDGHAVSAEPSNAPARQLPGASEALYEKPCPPTRRWAGTSRIRSEQVLTAPTRPKRCSTGSYSPSHCEVPPYASLFVRQERGGVVICSSTVTAHPVILSTHDV